MDTLNNYNNALTGLVQAKQFQYCKKMILDYIIILLVYDMNLCMNIFDSFFRMQFCIFIQYAFKILTKSV